MIHCDREVRRRLAVLRDVEEVTGNVAMTARYFGLWMRCYRAAGLEGLRESFPAAQELSASH